MIVQAVEECSPPDTVTLDGEKADAFTDLAHVSRHRCLSMTKRHQDKFTSSAEALSVGCVEAVKNTPHAARLK